MRKTQAMSAAPHDADAAAAISRELLRIHNESYAPGNTTAKTYITDDAVICFLDHLELLPNEAFMIENGETRLVVEMRRSIQRAAGPSFIAAVERATGRTVTNFFSETALDPPFSVELFRLALPTQG